MQDKGKADVPNKPCGKNATMQTCMVASLFQDYQTSQATPMYLGAGDTCITDKYYECNAENIFLAMHDLLLPMVHPNQD